MKVGGKAKVFQEKRTTGHVSPQTYVKMPRGLSLTVTTAQLS